MATRPDRSPLVASLLDRLLDDAPDSPQDPVGRVVTLESLRAAVRRDLEDLLNTRQRVLSWPASSGEVTRSVITYGIPDPSAAPLSGQRQRTAFLRSVEAVIRRHEPRFKRVAIVDTGGEEPEDRVLRFRIEAVMYANPAPLPVQFDSSVEPIQRTFRIQA